MQTIVQGVEIKSNMLLRLLKEEKLELTEESPIVLKCERCGKRIYGGVRCQECSFEMNLRINQLKYMALIKSNICFGYDYCVEGKR